MTLIDTLVSLAAGSIVLSSTITFLAVLFIADARDFLSAGFVITGLVVLDLIIWAVPGVSLAGVLPFPLPINSELWIAGGLMAILFGWWGFRARFVKGRTTGPSIARDIRRKAERVFRSYSRVGQIFAGMVAVGFVALAGDAAGVFLGEVVGLAGANPVITSHLAAIPLVYVTTGGALNLFGVTVNGPVISSSVLTFALTAMFTFAVGWRYAS